MRRPLPAALALMAIAIVAIVVWRAFFDSTRASASSFGEPIRKVALDGGDYATLIKTKDGARSWVVDDDRGGLQQLSPTAFEEYLEHGRAAGSTPRWLSSIFNVSSAAGLIWVALGLFGQLLFTARMLVQWLASEKNRRSVVPPLFWWLSLVGASMLLAYFVWRRDAVGVLGQAFGWIVYVRNIHLIYFGKGAVTTTDDPGPEPELAEPTLTGRRQPHPLRREPSLQHRDA